MLYNPRAVETLRFAGLNEENLASQVIHASFLKIIHDLILRNFLELEEASFSDFCYLFSTLYDISRRSNAMNQSTHCV